MPSDRWKRRSRCFGRSTMRAASPTCSPPSATSGRQLGDRAGVAETLGALSSMYALQGQERRAADLLEEVGALYRELGNTWGLTIALSSLGLALIQLGELE